MLPIAADVDTDDKLELEDEEMLHTFCYCGVYYCACAADGGYYCYY